MRPTKAHSPRIQRSRSSLARRLAPLGMLALALGGCQTSVVTGKVIEGPSSIVALVDAKDDRFSGPGIGGAETELRAVRDGLSDRLVSRQVTNASGDFSIGTIDRLTSESLMLIVSRSGYITAKGPASISADGKEVLVVLKKTAK